MFRRVSADGQQTFIRHMFSYFTEHEYRPCTICGTSLTRAERDVHVCDDERRSRFEAFQLGHELASFDRDFSTYLASPAGRFDCYYAERERRRLP
jgi:hypothetical protein